MENYIYDVIVIGAGPAGAIAARTLAKYDRRVLLVDKGYFPGREKACGGMLPLEAFRDYELDESTIESRMEWEEFIFPWGNRIKPQSTVTVKRNIFDAHLARLAQRAGVEFVQGACVKDVIQQTNNKFQLTIITKEGLHYYHCHLVIFADGVNTLANKKLGIGYCKTSNNVAVGLEYSFDAPGNAIKTYSLFFDHPLLTPHWGYSWVFPNRDHLNIGVFLPMDRLRTHKYHGGILENFLIEKSGDPFFRLMNDRRVLKKSSALIPMEPAKKLCASGALVVGDAAGLVFPVTAGGIGIALWSGRLAGETAHKALIKKDYSRSGLIDYENTIKTSGIYRELVKQSLFYRYARKFGYCDLHFFAKFFQIYKLKNENSFFEKIKVCLYR